VYRNIPRRFVCNTPSPISITLLFHISGGSHDRTDLLPLKAGVSVIALGAMANDPNVKVKIVPVGLSYFHPHRFRSRSVVEFGRAMDVPAEYVEMYKEGGMRKREAVTKLLDLIYDALKTVTIRAPDYDTLMVSLHSQSYSFHALNFSSSSKPCDDYTKRLDNT
jgi:1-acyl-sn-glycerol-3-phosphate acyltransferase